MTEPILKPRLCVAWFDRETKRKHWCATYRCQRPDLLSRGVRTACGFAVAFCREAERRLPTCERCLAVMRDRAKRRRAA
jgi:hypothetical protein